MRRYTSGPESMHSLGNSISSASAPVHSPRRGMIADGPTSNLHASPVSVVVSATGEKKLIPFVGDRDRVSKSVSQTNPFFNDQKECPALHESSSEERLPQNASKKPKVKNQSRRKTYERERRKAAKIILTQRNSARPKPQRVQISVCCQTDVSLPVALRATESIGDPGRYTEHSSQMCPSHKLDHTKCCDMKSLSYSNTKSAGMDKFLVQLLKTENFKIASSFFLMLVLIFWLTSVLLDVDNIFLDFLQMIYNYLRSFKLVSYRKEPETFTEKYLGFVANLFG